MNCTNGMNAQNETAPQNAYARAGVDTEAGDLAVELMAAAVKKTHGPAVAQDGSGFAGMYDARLLQGMRRPLLATSTDGVGTKVAIAWALDIHHTIGQDLVGMVVDDLSPLGVRPLFMTDYIACGKVVPGRIADIVRGIASACAAVDCALVGGETAEHPGLLGPDEYDVAGAATGAVDAPHVLGPRRVRAGDVLIGLASSGVHSNGYSLVRAIMREQGWSWDGVAADLPAEGWSVRTARADVSLAEAGAASPAAAPSSSPTWGEALLEPTRLYSRLCLDLADAGYEAALGGGTAGAGREAAAGPSAEQIGEENELAPNLVHAFAHVTGGGLGANLARVVPAGLAARVDRGAWEVPALFKALCQAGRVDWVSAEDTWNLGVGMVAVVAPEFADRTVAMARAAGIDAFVLGDIVDGAASPVLLPTGAANGSTAANAGGAAAGLEKRTISGTKGVKGGSVTLSGTYR